MMNEEPDMTAPAVPALWGPHGAFLGPHTPAGPQAGGREGWGSLQTHQAAALRPGNSSFWGTHPKTEAHLQLADDWSISGHFCPHAKNPQVKEGLGSLKYSCQSRTRSLLGCAVPHHPRMSRAHKAGMSQPGVRAPLFNLDHSCTGNAARFLCLVTIGNT